MRNYLYNTSFWLCFHTSKSTGCKKSYRTLNSNNLSVPKSNYHKLKVKVIQNFSHNWPFLTYMRGTRWKMKTSCFTLSFKISFSIVRNRKVIKVQSSIRFFTSCIISKYYISTLICKQFLDFHTVITVIW